LFNHQDDFVVRAWRDNTARAILVSVSQLSTRKCLPVYEALVDFQFVDPNIPTIPEGENMRFVVLNEEIPGLGWRIEEVNTAPGVSARLCAP
jgi:hypothetical protein